MRAKLLSNQAALSIPSRDSSKNENLKLDSAEERGVIAASGGEKACFANRAREKV